MTTYYVQAPQKYCEITLYIYFEILFQQNIPFNSTKKKKKNYNY